MLPAPQETCANCLKPSDLCVCSLIRPLDTRIHILILQHPQEPDKDLGSARIAHLSLPNSTLKIGLSWPNLAKALGHPAVPSRWAVLYLGSGIKSPSVAKKALHLVNKKGATEDSAHPRPGSQEIDGIVILDGTWSQAKALWWRNPWILKLRRAILTPSEKSLYRELRREPRGECLSTIESIAEALVALGEPPETGKQLKALFGELLNKQRSRLKERRKPAPRQ